MSIIITHKGGTSRVFDEATGWYQHGEFIRIVRQDPDDPAVTKRLAEFAVSEVLSVEHSDPN